MYKVGHLALQLIVEYFNYPKKKPTPLTITSIPLPLLALSSVQFSSVAQSCPTLCNPMNSSKPGLPVHHQLPEFTQTHVHRIGDVIQPSHPLSSPSPPAPNPSQHQGLFQWWFFQSGGQSYWSFSFSVSPSISVHGWFPLGLIDFIFLLSKGLKRVFSSTTVWEHQFFGPQHSHLCSFHDGSEGKESACNAGDPGSIPQSERHSGEGNWNPLWNLAGEAHGQRSLVGYSPWGHRESDRTERLNNSNSNMHLLWLLRK